MKNSLKIIIAILLLLPGLAFAGDFVCRQIGETSGGGDLVLAPGRNDGVNRLYVNGAGMFEYSWQDSVWHKDTLEAVSGWVHKAVAAGFGRNDGICRIYARWPLGLCEYTYNGGVWTKVMIDNLNLEGNAIALGDIKNDDTIRVVAGIWDSLIVAYTYQSAGNTWKAETLGTTNNEIHGITVGQGRNDDTNRVYTGGWNARFYEYWYQSGVWNKYSLGYSYCSTIGDARNDGINRLYLEGLAEFTWETDHWTFNSMDTNSSSYSGRTVLSNGRNDGRNRLYVASDLRESADSVGYANAYILEKTYDSLTGWTRKELQAVAIGDPVPLDYIAAGQARNDGVNRIYGHYYYGELFEFTWADTINGVEQGVKDINVLNVGKALKVKPNPFYSYAAISNLPSDVELKIYDITGRLVEKTNSTKAGAKLNAGVYFVTAGGYKPAKMVKIK